MEWVGDSKSQAEWDEVSLRRAGWGCGVFGWGWIVGCGGMQ